MVTFNMIALSLFSDYGYLSCISICIFSSFHFRKQSCQLKQEKKKKKQTIHCHVLHTNANAQARCLAGPQCGKAVQASGFLGIDFITYLSPCGCDIWHTGNGGGGGLCSLNGAA